VPKSVWGWGSEVGGNQGSDLGAQERE
jgi:hypothetical protein